MKKVHSMELAAPTNWFSSKVSLSFRDNKGEFSNGKEKVSDSKGKLDVPWIRKHLMTYIGRSYASFAKVPMSLVMIIL